MTEQRIMSNHPSIQRIESDYGVEKFALSEQDTKKLFKPLVFPTFDMYELKKQAILNKHPIVSFFIEKIESWNKMCSSPNDNVNMRTQYLTNQFLYSSLKRIAAMKQNQMEGQLKVLYYWFTNNGKKKSSDFPQMPNKLCQNQAYDAIKSFDTNPTLLIDEYRRKFFNTKFSKKASEIQKQQITAMNNTFNTEAEKKVQNNFLTSPPKFTLQSIKKRDNFIYPEKIDKVYHKQQKQYLYNTKVFLNRACSNEKIRHDEVRRHRQMLELSKSQEKWRNQKSRLMEEISKNFYEGQFNTSARFVKSSQGKRTAESEEIRKIKQYRVQTSWKPNPLKIEGEKENLMPEIMEINNIGLIKNPQELKLKKKKKVNKRKN